MKCIDGCTCRRHIGHPQSDEVRAIISAAHKGETKSPEHRAKLAEASRQQWARHEGPAPNLGVKFSDGARANMAIARIGNKNAQRHGMAKTPTWYSWKCMLQRVDLPSNPSYKSYGGRGISVCDLWRQFVNFLADMGERPDGMTLDRIDNDKGYTPENCRWATAKEQRANQRPRQRRKEVSQVDAYSN